MIQGVDISQVKQYNESLKQYQNQASQVRAGIEYSTKELERLCGELSTELGVTVTPDNIGQIRQERIEKIQNTLNVGTEILKRIQSEEAAANAPRPAAPTPMAGMAPGVGANPNPMAGQPSPMANQMAGNPMTPPQMVPPAPQMAPPMFATQPTPPVNDIFNNIGSIPSIFGQQ